LQADKLFLVKIKKIESTNNSIPKTIIVELISKKPLKKKEEVIKLEFLNRNKKCLISFMLWQVASSLSSKKVHLIKNQMRKNPLNNKKKSNYLCGPTKFNFSSLSK
jgi:predicted ferric reductase